MQHCDAQWLNATRLLTYALLLFDFRGHDEAAYSLFQDSVGLYVIRRIRYSSENECEKGTISR